MLLVLDVGNTNTVLGVYELATDGAGFFGAVRGGESTVACES